MVLTEEKIQEILQRMAKLAKDIREGIPYSRTDAFANVVVFIGPNLEPAMTHVTWRNEDEKWHKMRGVSETAKEMLCQAVVLITDTRWVEEKNIRDLFGIPSVAEIGLEEFKRLYSKNLYEKYKGYLGNVPAQFWSEAICVVAKGPMIGTRSLMMPYTKGFDDKIRWLEKKDSPLAKWEATPESDVRIETQFPLIPAWWN